MILLRHIGWRVDIYNENSIFLFDITSPGVDLFFILSGFIIPYITYRKIKNIRTFIKERLRKIIPIYWFLTLAVFIIFLLFPEKINSTGREISLFNSLFLLQTTDTYLLQVAWTLGYIVFFYFIYSIGFFFKGEMKLFIPISIIIGLVAIGSIYKYEGDYYLFATRGLLLEFAFGICIYYLFISNRLVFNRYIAFLMIFISVSLYLYLNTVNGFGVRFLDNGVPSALLFIAILNFESFFKSIHSTLFGVTINKLGNSSYSLYLTHPLILTALSIIFVKLHLSQYGIFFSFALYFCSLIIGYLVFIYLEKPLNKILNIKRKWGW